MAMSFVKGGDRARIGRRAAKQGGRTGGMIQTAANAGVESLERRVFLSVTPAPYAEPAAPSQATTSHGVAKSARPPTTARAARHAPVRTASDLRLPAGTATSAAPRGVSNLGSGPPKVLTSSVVEGAMLVPGPRYFAITFDEPMLATGIDEGDFSLVGRHVGAVTGAQFGFNGARTQFSFNYFTPLVEDAYTLTLRSGNGRFEDASGDDLDGETPTWPLPAGGSGDGVAGGDFVVHFEVDAAAETNLGFGANSPLGSQVYAAAQKAAVSHAGDVDGYVLNLDADQTLTVLADPGSTALALSVDLLDPQGAVVATATAAAPGAPIVFQGVPVAQAGSYHLAVAGSAAGPLGTYTLSLYLNSVVESEDVRGAVNDSPAAAQALDSAFTTVFGAPATARRAAVAGGTAGRSVLASDSFESGNVLGPAWSTYSSAATGRVAVADPPPAGGGNALLMDATTAANVLNEAIWTVNLAGVASPTLTFTHASFGDNTVNSLPTGFSNHANGDGVSISANGTQWFRIWTPPTTTGTTAFSPVTLDLAALAQSSGVTLNATTRIKFQQYGGGSLGSGGRGFDDVAITASRQDRDYYAVTLAAGETLNAAVARQDTVTLVHTLNVYDAAGTVLAADVSAAANYDAGVVDFVAPSAGTYYLGVGSAASAAASPYRLLVTKGASIDREPNASINTAQNIEATRVALGALPDVGPGDSDFYRFTAHAGDVLTLATHTLAGGAGAYNNNTNARLDLYGVTDQLVASDEDSGEPPSNAIITYTVPASGWYKVRVGGITRFSAGDYVLTVTGATPQTDLPGAPDLLPTADTGVSSADDLTSFNNRDVAHRLAFAVPGTIPGATVTLCDSTGAPLGAAIAAGTTTTVTATAATLPDGPIFVTARQAAPGQAESGDSLGLTVTIDTAAPARPVAAPVLDEINHAGSGFAQGIIRTPFPHLGVAPNPYARVYADGALVSAGYVAAAKVSTSALVAGTHALAQTALDAAGNESAPSDPLNVVVDPVAPTATFAAANIPAPAGAYTFTITLSDNVAVNVESMQSAAVRVFGPNGQVNDVAFVSLDDATPGTPRTATYRALPSDGSWDAADDGTYTVSVGVSGTSLMYDMAGNPLPGGTVGTFDVAIDAPPAPAAPDLVAESDSGVSATDNLTNFNNSRSDRIPKFRVDGVTPGNVVGIYVGGVELATAQATGSSVVVAPQNVGGPLLNDNTYAVTAKQWLPGSPYKSANSAALPVTIDTTPPPPAPAAPVLAAGSDSGVSATDRVTNAASLTFNVTPGPYVALLQDSFTLVGDLYVSGTTITLTDVPDGSHSYRQVMLDAAGNANSSSSPDVDVVVDRTAPEARLPQGNYGWNSAAGITFSVNYFDAKNVDPTSFDGNDVLVTGPAGTFTAHPTLVSGSADAPSISNNAVYGILPPDGSWDAADNGTYTITLQPNQVRDIAGNAAVIPSSADATGTFTVAIGGAPDLIASSDTGSSHGDDVVNLNNDIWWKALTFSVAPTVPGNTVTLLADGVAIASVVATGAITSIVTNGIVPLSDGQHQITYRQTPAGGQQGPDSPAMTLTVDTAAPTATVAFDRAGTGREVFVAFSEPMGPIYGSNPLAVRKYLGGQPSAPVDFSFAGFTAGGTMAAFAPSAQGMLADGNYRAEFGGYTVADVAGNPLATYPSGDFFVLAGDASGNRSVGPEDFNILATNFGKTGQTWSTGDFDGDGAVGPSDFNLLATNFGKTLPPPPAPSQAVRASSSFAAPSATQSAASAKSGWGESLIVSADEGEAAEVVDLLG